MHLGKKIKIFLLILLGIASLYSASLLLAIWQAKNADQSRPISVHQASTSPKSLATTNYSATVLGASTHFVKIYVGENMVTQPGEVSTPAATSLAPHIDEYVTNVYHLSASTAKAMKAANPNLRILIYLNASYAQDNQGPQTAGAYAPSLYQTNGSSQYLRSNGFHNWLMDLTQSGWKTDRNSQAQSKISSYGAYVDGVWLDLLGVAPVLSGYDYASDADGEQVKFVSNLPYNQAAGHTYTRSEWMTNTIAIAKGVASFINKSVGGNGLAQGNQYFASDSPTKQLFTGGLNDIMAEEFIRPELDGITQHSRNFYDWKKDVDMLVDAGKLGKQVETMTKVWTSDTPAEINAWHRFALASFMLGTDGNSSFGFVSDKNWSTPLPYWDEANQIGSAQGAYFQSGSMYERNYTNGLVVVNPSASSASLGLNGTYQTLDGAQVTSLTLGAYSGEVLKLIPASNPASSGSGGNNSSATSNSSTGGNSNGSGSSGSSNSSGSPQSQNSSTGSSNGIIKAVKASGTAAYHMKPISQAIVIASALMIIVATIIIYYKWHVLQYAYGRLQYLGKMLLFKIRHRSQGTPA